MVSGFHARIDVAADEYWIEDLGSTNGTAIDSIDNKITRDRLSPDQAIFFGSLRIPASRLLGGSLSLGVQPYTACRLDQREIVLGRDTDCDIVLEDPQVSRRHARVVRNEDEPFVEDLDSANGTFVNGVRIKGRVPIKPGDVIAIGSHSLTVTSDGNLEQRDWRGNVAVQACNVTVAVPKKRLLDEISLTIYPSEFVGLMGLSGAGKTTLMNALNGYTPPASGTVSFNGIDLYGNYSQFQGAVGYVPQDDIMHSDLTVEQALYYTARLRLPSDYSEGEIQQRIQEVVGKLGLRGTEDTLIGSPQRKGISGGQRKRVNLAMELLTDPSVLFLDEPTSGLSSEDALMVMRLLRELADDGKTILLTVHQPSLEAYRQLDNLILVGRDADSSEPGRLAYYGPAYPQAVEFFNPDSIPGQRPGADPSPDDVLRGFSRKKMAQWTSLYAVSPVKRQFVDDRRESPDVPRQARGIQTPHRDFGFNQWWMLVRRCLSVKIKDTTNTAILMVQAPIIALLIGLVFGKQATQDVTPSNWPSIAGAVSTSVFLLALASLWFGCSNSAREIVGEWSIYRRERMVNLKISSYVGSKFAILGSLCLVQCVILLAIVSWFVDLRAPWLPMFLVLFLTSLVGLAIGLLISSLARTSEVAIALLPLILLPMVILAGLMQPVHKMNGAVAIAANVMPSRWAFEALLLLEVEHRPTWEPPIPDADLEPGLAPGAQVESGETPDQQGVANTRDMAEQFFPALTERKGVRVSVIALLSMLICTGAAIQIVLRLRDIH